MATHTRIDLMALEKEKSMKDNISMQNALFEWYPTECVPTFCPAIIISGSFLLVDESLVSFPTERNINNNWGDVGSCHLTENNKHAVPKKLNIVWFSYITNKFFGGSFDLPTMQIFTLFNEAVNGPSDEKLINYNKIAIGIAPDGFLSIWLSVSGIFKEVATFWAEEIDIEWKMIFEELSISRDEYIKANLAELLPAEYVQKNGTNTFMLKQWEKYSTKYNFEIQYNSSIAINDVWVHFFNGEHYFYNKNEVQSIYSDRFALPERIEFSFNSNQNRQLVKINFDYFEIFKSIEKLNAGSTKEKFTIQININHYDKSVEVIIANQANYTILKKVQIKKYSKQI